jgi:Mce-associated membrane protein
MVSKTAIAPPETTNDEADDASDVTRNADDGETAPDPTDSPDTEAGDEIASAETDSGKPKRRIRWSRIVAFGLLPAFVIALAAAAGFLKWQASSMHTSDLAGMEAIQAAKDTTVALLSYNAESVEKDLGAATERLTGPFKKDYDELTHKVVIPGAKQQHISTTATIAAAAPVSATGNHAVVLLLVNQTTTAGTDRPSILQSSVRATMDKVDGRWLMAGFDPI